MSSPFVRNQGTSSWQGDGAIMTDGASAASGNRRSGGEIVICGSTFTANSALATDGGVYLYAYGRDRVTVSRSSFTANAQQRGCLDGRRHALGASPALVSDSTFRNNIARTGGAVATNGEAQTQVGAQSSSAARATSQAVGRSRRGDTSRGCWGVFDAVAAEPF